MFALPAKSQVTIGDNSEQPQPFSMLELATSLNQGGLRMPQLTTVQRKALNAGLTGDNAAKGLVVYDTDLNCLEFWNGTTWISMCDDILSAVDIDPATIYSLPLGVGSIMGRTCFDIAVSNDGINNSGTLAGRVEADFSKPAINRQTYVFRGAGGTGDVRYVIQDPEGALANTQPLIGRLAVSLQYNTSVSFTLQFKDNLNSPDATPKIVGRTRNNADSVVVNIIYHSGATDVRVAPFVIKIQDGNCCGAKTTPSGNWVNFMCYNMGASDVVKSLSPNQQAAYSNVAENYGDLYQWGRQTDGHESRTSTPIAGPATSLNGNGQPSSAFAGKFITATSDWSSSPNATLWSSSRTANDPCPDGWRVPTSTEWQSILNGTTSATPMIPVSGYSSSSGNWWKFNTPAAGTAGWTIISNGGMGGVPTLFLPAGFSRNGTVIAATITSTMNTGFYWSSSSSGANSNYLTFTSSNITPGNNIARVYGYSVRCISATQ